jgi:hypothetical protein
MAEKLQSFNVLSYLSSHDTRLFREGGSVPQSCSCWHQAAYKSTTGMNPNAHSARQDLTRFREHVRI